jgi:hypothetical protein
VREGEEEEKGCRRGTDRKEGRRGEGKGRR